SVGGSTSTTNLTEYIDNSNGGVIDNGGNVTLNTVGPVMLDGALVLEVDNFNGGTINTGANVTAHFVGDVTDTVADFHSLNWFVINGRGFFTPTATGGTIGTGGNLDVTFDGNASTTGTSTTGSIAAEIFNGAGGSIGTGGNISMTVGGNLMAGPLFLITENQGGHIGTGGDITLQVSGGITTQGDAVFQISNNDNGDGSGPGTIGSDATINVTAANISVGGSLFDDILNSGGVIGGNTTISANVADVSLAGALVELISNAGGDIVGNAGVNATAGTVTTGTTDLNIGVYSPSGSIGGSASVTFVASGDVNATGNSFFQIVNGLTGVGAPSSSIGNDATVSVSAANFSTTGQLYVLTDNTAGTISGDVALGFIATGDISDSISFFRILNSNDGNGSVAGTLEGAASIDASAGGTWASGYTEFSIFNGGGLIGSDATITLGVGNMTADTLVAQIDNTGGSIGASTEGGATINMNVSGTATVTNDATVAIYGSDGAVGGAAIN